MIQLLHDVDLLLDPSPPIFVFQGTLVEDLDGYLPACELVHCQGYSTEGALTYQLDESVVAHFSLMRDAKRPLLLSHQIQSHSLLLLLTHPVQLLLEVSEWLREAESEEVLAEHPSEVGFLINKWWWWCLRA